MFTVKLTELYLYFRKTELRWCSFLTHSIRRVFGISSRSSTKVMLHLTKLPSMQERAYIFQSQFLLRSFTLPEDTLLSRLLCYIRRSNNKRALKQIQVQFRRDNLCQNRSSRNSTLLSLCRPIISLDPILWLPMTRIERNRCVRWRLGWLPGGTPRPCSFHPSQTLTKSHSIHCLNMHRQLQLPETIVDPRSFLGPSDGLLSVPSSMSSITYTMTRFRLHRHPILGKDSSNGFPMSPASVSYT
ncbi:hypothetical protein G6F43_012546 [Rhizopus delemar]|nr:hypothetical protein G6F43_012546 [Rhizopus delemar]